MSGNFNDLGKRTSDVISNFERTDFCFWQLEKEFTDMQTIISKRSKR